MVCGSDGLVPVNAVTACGTAARTVRGGCEIPGRDSTAFPIAVSVLASTPGPPVGSSTSCCRLFEPPLGPPTGAVTAAGASGSVAVESATGSGAVVSSVVDSAATSPVAGVSLLDLLDESATGSGAVVSSVVDSAAPSPVAGVSLLDLLDESAPPVASTIPGGSCRTDASVDAEVLD